MDKATYTKKDIGALGEKITAEYLRRLGFTIIDMNVARKSGEIDVIAKKGSVIHFVEVKSVMCEEFPDTANHPPNHPQNHHANQLAYSPAMNLHAQKIQKVIRTSQWYVANIGWKGEWQVDGALVWIRKRDTLARIRYLPQIV